MKKLSFFLMAMLFSMMSFAQTVLFTQTYPGSPSAWTNAYTNSFYLTTDGYKLTYQNINNGKQADRWTAIRSGSKRAASVATILSEQIAKPIAKVAINFTQVKASSTNALYLEVSATADFASATKIEADIAKGTVEFAIATPAANQYYRVTIDQKKDSDNGFNRWDKVIFYEGEAASGDVEIVAAPEYSVANANFTTPFTLEITSAEGTTLKYTLDNTDPNTSATAVEVATNKTTVEIAKSTVVKAIAIKGELVSVTKTKTYSYVNTPETAYTVAEAIEVINSGLGLDNELYAKGEIYKIDSYNATYKSITYWIKDEANNQLQVYSGRGLNNTDFASKDDLVVGSKVVICGILKKYNSTYEFDKTNYIVSLTLPSYTVTATAENGSVAGLAADGKYEHGAEATLTATAAEGYEFVNWTVGEEVVSTENPYTFAVTADVEVVANFKEAEPEYNIMDITMTNLVVEESGDLLVLTASDDSNTGLNVMLAINEDGSLAADSYMALVQGWNETELPIVEGKITKAYNEELATDVYSGLVVVEYMGGKLGLNLTMYAAPAAPAIDVVVDNATITVETEDDGLGGTYEVITVSANWQESVLVIEGIEKEFEGFIQIKEIFEVDGEEDWYIWMCMNGVVTTVDNVLTVTGEFKNNWTGDVYNVTISGALPVEEPEVITYELNGGELPTATVPTQDSLIAAFKDGYNAYFGVSVATTRTIDNFLYAGAAVNDPKCDVSLFMKDDASSWKWLGDYILAVTNAQIEAGTLSTLKELATELMWRQSLTGFFLQQAKLDSNYKGNADFTEAGKPEAWGAAYQAAHAVVLPTEPVDAPYTLPTPVKEGYKFVGWYDNAAGAGDAYTVIPAGWSGTLYAIWEVEGPGTALENIAVEGKAVKAIINGQLIIIKNGVQYNAQGQVVK